MMRLRNIPRAEGVLKKSEMVIKQPETLKGRWASEIFRNQRPIHIEIGMGKGQFLLELSRQNPDVNYIGIERYSSVLLRAVEKPEEDRKQTPGDLSSPETSYANLRFLCTDAANIVNLFAPSEISKIYLNFSDPWPKARHARRRLTSSEFLDRYDKILTADGQIEFKTDNRGLFEFSLEQLKNSDHFRLTACTFDLHHDAEMNQGNIMTEYEEKFSSMNHPICKFIAARK